ncbi:S8 family serine peptidase [Sphingomonas sp. CFBP 13720]|uniref:S8 family serine peptidase n=1 Tax=Sphingomonas sp. CFBP 13720 TaxID=2775302 RepID=UPI001782BBFC|nr:S8 family serine peptidase [Sphingomonas sp. CFBP 13720]MBD8679968.1 S8 family serine peptidase [Sphingomonas sp. CFBP 13720]
MNDIGRATIRATIAGWDETGNTGAAGQPQYGLMDAGPTAATVAIASLGLADPEAAGQWHLGKLGDIAKIWEDYTGKGVKVGVYDSGVQYGHYDLASNYDASLHVTIDGKTYDGDYSPLSGAHGTSVAGLIAAARNGVGTVGVAYDATLTGVNIFDPYSGGKLNPGIYINAADDSLFIEAMRQTNKFDVVNHSWGSTASLYGSTFSRGVEGTGAYQIAQAVTYAAETGRDGLGTIQLNAAGNNSIDAQGDSSHTDRHWISVGAYREVDGLASNYSSRGASLLVSAPSNDLAVIGGTGVVATDLLGKDGYNLIGDPGGRLDYTDQFGGTSAASPIAAGVVTLMLDANAGLGWRDVSNILANSAKLPIAFDLQARNLAYTDPVDGFSGTARMNESRFVVSGAGSNTQSNGGGLHYSTDYGYGAIDAFAAVRMAEVWSLFGDAKTSANEVHYASTVFETNLLSGGDSTIDFTTAWDRFEGNQVGYEFAITDADIDLEHVDMTITYTSLVDFTEYGLPGLFPYDFGANRLKLTAPDGTSAFVDTLQGFGLNSAERQSFTFGFANFRGVSAVGTWKIELEATNNGVTTIHNVKLDLYGSAPTANDVFTYTDEFATMAAIAGEAGRRTLVDSDGGIDWINAAAVTSNVSLSLIEGTSTSIGGASFTIATGSVIEHAVTGDGNDTLTGNALDNELRGMRGDDTLFGNAGNDRLYGGAGNDQLFGGVGNDLLDGGAGIDFLSGGAGDDIYVVDTTDDQISEFGGSGSDTVRSSVSWTLAAGLENLTLTGSAAINATGNAGDNLIVGNAGANRLSGGAGNDTIATVAGAMLIAPGGGSDTVDGGSGVDTLHIGGVRSDYQLLTSGERTFVVSERGAIEMTGVEQVQLGHGGTTTLAGAGLTAFDGLAYIASYSDLRVAFGADAAQGVAHFTTFGFGEGRSLTFNALDYIASYGDLIAAFGTDATAGASHFITFGATEGRSSSFDGWAYLASYGDLISAFGADETAAARHYIEWGVNEGRGTTFDAAAYAAANTDLLATYGNDGEALARHYVTWGYAEGRTFGVAAAPANAAAPTVVAAATFATSIATPANDVASFADDAGLWTDAGFHGLYTDAFGFA